jgi:hypothetical protein
LGDKTQWAKADTPVALDEMRGEDRPLLFVHHVRIFLAEEFYALFRGLVGPSLEQSLDAARGQGFPIVVIG